MIGICQYFYNLLFVYYIYEKWKVVRYFLTLYYEFRNYFQLKLSNEKYNVTLSKKKMAYRLRAK